MEKASETQTAPGRPNTEPRLLSAGRLLLPPVTALMINDDILHTVGILSLTPAIATWSNIVSILLALSTFRGGQTTQTVLGTLPVRFSLLIQHTRLMINIISEIDCGGSPDLCGAYIAAFIFTSKRTDALFLYTGYNNRATGSVYRSFDALVRGSGQKH